MIRLIRDSSHCEQINLVQTVKHNFCSYSGSIMSRIIIGKGT